MKKLLLITLCVAILATTSGMAMDIKKEEAAKVAVNAYFEKMNKYADGIAFYDVSIINEYTRYADGVPAFYAFDFAGGGFMIISAEDAFTPIIGYSHKGEFPKGEHAYVYASFLQEYVDQINYIRDNDVKAEPAIAQEWDYYLTGDIANLDISKDGKDIDPLLTNLWNQDDPYNLDCPEDPDGPGGHAYVGCVGTAMAMIMHYYGYPLTGENDHCYTPTTHPEYGELCVDFGTTTYQWTGMKDQIDGTYPWPVTEISYHCAVSVNMDFGPDGSGTQSELVASRAGYFFNYDNAEFKNKVNFTMTDWKNMLYAELDAMHPVYYSGCSASGCHAFVCDGYQGSDFHFNFGWSGSGNGFYTLYNVGGYSSFQKMVRYFYPTDPAYPYHASGQTVIKHFSGQFTDGSGPIEDYLSNTEASWLIDPQTENDSVSDITIKFIDFNLGSGDYVRIYDGETTSAPMLGEFTGNTLPGQLTTTGNKLLVTLSSDGSGNGSGFKAEYSSDFPSYCGSGSINEYTAPLGSFGDGSGSFYYTPGDFCLFRIEPPSANTITITFTEFETEEGQDKLEVYDGGSLVDTYSGNDIPDPIVITSGKADLRWTTSKLNNMQGWELEYEIDNVGVEEPEAFTQLDIFPNPASGILNINFRLEDSQSVELQLVNITGESVYSETLTNVAGEISNSIDISKFAKGIYILNLTSARGHVNKKVIIK
jgi:hypothetical protein